MGRFSLVSAVVALVCSRSFAYYFSEVNPQSFEEGDEVKLKVNKMTSTHTLMPLEYYRLPFCIPEGGPNMENENLGQFLAGDRIESSPYLLKMKTEMYCEQVCVNNIGHGGGKGVSPNKLVRAIRKNYHNNWIVDNLSAASKSENKFEDTTFIITKYFEGFPIGFMMDDKAYINNHVNLEIMFHQDELDTSKYRIVRFTVEPFSIKHVFDLDAKPGKDTDNHRYLPTVTKIKNPIESCGTNPNKVHTSFEMQMSAGFQEVLGQVLFTYDVIWIENKEVTWASRWDIYLTMFTAIEKKERNLAPQLDFNMNSPRVHWLSIATSLVIVLVLSVIIIAILVRNLHLDIDRYNKVTMDEETRAEELEEYGWKLVCADVFRPPSYSPMLLSVLCGSGAQLLFMTLFTLIFSAMGFMNPTRRGHLLMGKLMFFVAMGSVNGYTTARLYKTFQGKSWQRATRAAALSLPGLVFGIFFVMNIVALINESTYAVPFVTMFILIVMWFGISTPLVFLGAYFGYKQDAIAFPVTTSNIPRQIPDQPWFMGIPFTLAIGGILPFRSCFIELCHVISSMWVGFYYFEVGFLFMVFLILLVTCAEITVLFTYFQLCREDYRWWWRSFSNAGSTAIYVFFYSILYFKQLEANSVSTYILYFGYMGICSVALFCMMGFVGLSTSLWFNKTIFA